MSGYTLVIGNKNYSSRSLRPWLALKATGSEFEEILIPLYREDSRAKILRYSPSGFVPVLLENDTPLAWDSLAICETFAERHPEAKLWPDDSVLRAHARSISAEMHSGFPALRRQCSMNMRKRETIVASPEVAADVARIETLWAKARALGGKGDFLYDHFTLADAMYAPVVSRFISYGIALKPESRRYVDAVWAWPALQQWYADAQKRALGHMKDHPTLKGIGYVLFSILIWSGWIVVSRYSVRGSLNASDITAIRFATSGLILLPVALRKGISIGPLGSWGGVILALCMGATYTNIAVAGMRYAPASHAATIINGTLLVLTTIVGIHGLREETSRLRLLGVACSLGGIGCMLLAKPAGDGSLQWLGHSLFVVSGTLWGTYTLLVRAWKAPPAQTAAAVCVLSMVGYMPIYLLALHSNISMLNWREVAFQCFYQGALTGVIALMSFNRGIHLLGASHAGAFLPLVPVLSTLLAIPFLGEMPSALEWAGVGAVSVGVLIASGILGRRARPLPLAAAQAQAEHPVFERG